MAKSAEKLNVSRQYKAYGGERPPLGHLERMRQQLDTTANGTHTVWRYLLAGELDFDAAAADPARAEEFLSSAETNLINALLAGTNHADEKQPFKKSRRHANIVAAALRLSDLPTWRGAVTGEEPQTSYEFLVRSSMGAYRAVRSFGSNVEGMIAEELPILSIARFGAFGVGAFRRQDQQEGFDLDLDGNPSFDCVVAEPNAVGTLLDAHRPVQMKLRPRDEKEADAYRRGGVLPVYAPDFGWERPRLIVASCMAEYEDPSRIASELHLERSELLSSAELDDNFGRATEYILH